MNKIITFLFALLLWVKPGFAQTNALDAVVDFSASDTVISVGDSIDFYNNSTGANFYYMDWYIWSGPVSQSSNAYAPKGITFSQAGTYSVSLLAYYTGWPAKLVTKENYITVLPSVGIRKNENALTFTLNTYPNPVTDVLHVECMDQLVNRNMEVSIINQLGQVIIRQSHSSGVINMKYDLSGFPSGIYSVVISSGEMVLVQKVVKQ